jgi:predicted MarR family transcription regulator
MIQLVGYHVWLQNEGKKEISGKDVKVGIQAAKRRLGSTIHAISLSDLSNVDRTFLTHMATSDTPITVSDMAQKMHVSGSYISQYRKRLIESGIIVSTAHGEVDFAIPYIKEYLQEHIASDYIELQFDQ